MISLTSLSKAQLKIAEHIQARRLFMELTQEGLAERLGYPLQRSANLSRKVQFP
jgi:hypothetical protein